MHISRITCERLGKAYQTTNDTSEVENDPEDGDKFALLVLIGVTHHDGTLRSPQKTGANTKQSTGKDEKTGVLIVVVGEKRSDIEEVTKTTNAQGQT